MIGFDPDPADQITKARLRAPPTGTAEYSCACMPRAIYVKLDDCELQLLPPAPCYDHWRKGRDASCASCINAVQPGVLAVQPLVRQWKHFYSSEDKTKFVTISRRQFPLVPAPAVSLYSMQGTTVDPGMVAYCVFPQKCSEAIQWLIVYIMLSRPRALASLRSLGLTTKVWEIIERGPPEDLVANF